MPEFEIVPRLHFVTRDTWKANPKYPRLGNRVARKVRTHVIIHHTVKVDRSDDTPNIWERKSDIFKMMRELQVMRGRDLGFDVPYNFVAFLKAQGDSLYICEG